MIISNFHKVKESYNYSFDIIIFLLLAIPPLQSQNEEITFYFDSTRAWRGEDMELLSTGEIVVIGSEFSFNPPYSGIPIDGEPCLGNILLLIDEDGNLQDNARIPNWYNSIRPPANFIYSIGKNELIVPYYRIEAIDTCSTFHKRRSLSWLETKNKKLILADSTYGRNQVECLNPKMASAGVSLEEPTDIATIDLDEKYNWDSPGPYILNLYDREGKHLQKAEIHHNWLTIVNQTKNLFFKDSSIFLFCSHKTSDYGSGFFEISFNGDSLNFYPNSGIHYWHRNILYQDENSIFVDGSNFDIGARFLIKYDHHFNEIWRITIPMSLISVGKISFQKLPDETFIITHNQNQISHYDTNGKLLASKSYPVDNLLKILMKNNEEFIALGTDEEAFSNTDWGNPFYKIFILNDKISNLTSIVNNSYEPIKNKFEIYPNPANSILRISQTIPQSSINIKIYSITGSLVFSQKSSNSIVDVSNLSQGMYIIKINNSEAKRFIKH